MKKLLLSLTLVTCVVFANTASASWLSSGRIGHSHYHQHCAPYGVNYGYTPVYPVPQAYPLVNPYYGSGFANPGCGGGGYAAPGYGGGYAAPGYGGGYAAPGYGNLGYAAPGYGASFGVYGR